MQLLEFQAKQLLTQAGLLVPTGAVVAHNRSSHGITFPIVVKSQVPVGGRGKLGGVKLVRSQAELETAIATISQLSIKGFVPSELLLEEALEIERELYVSLQVNRDKRRLEWLVSAEGGVEIESHADQVVTVPYHAEQTSSEIAELLHVPIETMGPFLKKLAQCFFNNDLLLLELNPLVVTSAGELVCADAKVVVDDNARFRHSSLPWKEQPNVKPLGGSIGVIANGAGMAMSTMDSIYAAGGQPANFLDIGGGTGEEVFVKNLREINRLPNVRCIIVNIFAGITRCDDIARGIIAATQQIPELVPLFIRLEGTNHDQAADLLEKAGVRLQTSLKACIDLALELDNSLQPTVDREETIGQTNKRVLPATHFSTASPASVSGDSAFPAERGDTSWQLEPSETEAGAKHRENALETIELLFNNNPVIVQGITGHHGAFHTEHMLNAGTDIVAGVTPGKGGQKIHDVPVYNSGVEALVAHPATSSVVFVPAPFAKAAVFEAIDAGLKLVVIITEGIPVHDMLAIHEKAFHSDVAVVGPNCPGFIVPNSHKLGIIASHITSPGHTTIISRSGTLTYELAAALTQKGIGQRLILGIGGDPVQGLTFTQALRIAQTDSETKQIVLVGEIGGAGENVAADFIASQLSKPVYGLVVGHSLPPGQTFGHAGAIVGSHGETAAAKTSYLQSQGVHMFTTLDELVDNITAV